MGKQTNKVDPGRKRARYTKEFKLEAVRLLEQGEKTGAQLALELRRARWSGLAFCMARRRRPLYMQEKR